MRYYKEIIDNKIALLLASENPPRFPEGLVEINVEEYEELLAQVREERKEAR
jgi:hypothetical protein